MELLCFERAFAELVHYGRQETKRQRQLEGYEYRYMYMKFVWQCAGLVQYWNERDSLKENLRDSTRIRKRRDGFALLEDMDSINGVQAFSTRTGASMHGSQAKRQEIDFRC